MDRTETLKALDVAVSQDSPVYCDVPPYDPSELYPEYVFGAEHVSVADNPAYRLVRQNFMLLGLDSDNAGTPEWNPLKSIVRAGDAVVIKPNFVIDKHYEGGDIFAIITHPSVLRAVVDYCLIALKGSGSVVIADAPVEDCDFGNLLATTHMREVQDAYRERLGVDVQVIDLRRYASKAGDGSVYGHTRESLAGDPLGDVVVDLGETSALYGKPGPFFGADPDTTETKQNHNGSIHRYQLSKTILSCDVLISVPKLKVHKKVGVTLNLKGMVGANTNKNFLVHYTLGTPCKGGDQAVDPSGVADSLMLRIRKMISDIFVSGHISWLERVHSFIFHSRPYLAFRALLRRLGLAMSAETEATDGGNWFGNDTCWRMVADLARIMCYADKDGALHDTPQRRLFSVVDGVIGGDGNGPLRPRARPVGVVLSGFNPLAVDLVSTYAMGFDPHKLPLFAHLMGHPSLMCVNAACDITVKSDRSELADCVARPGTALDFAAHPNWAGHLEVGPLDSAEHRP